MEPYVIGTADDVEGFLLSGVAGEVCTSRDAVLEAARGRTLIVLSAAAARLIADRIDAWERDTGAPMWLVLPDPGKRL